MGTIEEIIKIVDDKLIETGKEYLLLGYANQLLVEKKVLTISDKSNKLLKKLLEEKNLSHAYQTQDSPRQWRIPLSNDGKRRKKLKTKKKEILISTPNPNKPITKNRPNINQNVNQVICPSCRISLFVPTEILNENYIKCLSCGNEFQNPIKINHTDDSLKLSSKTLLIIVAVIFVLWTIGRVSSNQNNTTTNSKVENNYLDASVSQVEKYLKNEYLNDPSSYKSVEWSQVNEMTGDNGEYKYWVRHKYRAKNSYGAYVIENNANQE